MVEYPQIFKFESSPVTAKEYVFISGDVRLSLLSPALLRVERVKGAAFCDAPTQSVWFRSFCSPEFELRQNGSEVTVQTPAALFCVSVNDAKVKYITLSDGRRVTDFKKGNLKGTCRTLDRSFGAVKIGDGVVSRKGVAVLDDSKSLVLTEDGKILPRTAYGEDKYYFAHGNDYRGAVADLFKLTGYAPLVPRFALGNWWSRYKAYTQDEYLTLMKRFADEEIPITVATVDMDWHWVDVVGKFGKESKNKAGGNNLMEKIYDILFSGGWTGYSWNTDLFPDPQGFLKKLKDSDLKVTLNVHPATGARWFEDSYRDFARFMGIDPESREQIPFDITDPKFIEGYFRFLHHPHEDAGVDFWWLDWQQGNKSKVEGLDPLWALNHYHSLDISREGKRPLILSRFAGAGSQRYPLGFSGDTAQNWKVLDFQPYFTSTASNIGYTWWSHDIGGHHFGKKDDELYLRWVQYGVFSPVMRLHSTANEFMGKEPWKFSGSVETLARDALRLRHRLIPYLYTMNYRTHSEGKALCEPMYYAYPDADGAYKCKNEYLFGSELIVAPITSPCDSATNLACSEVWLPAGRYTDIFNGRIYNGNQIIKMFRDYTSIPVLAREGSIIPLGVNDRNNDSFNPKELEMLIYRGTGSFTMYEDDGETLEYKDGVCAFTEYSVTGGESDLCFTIHPVSGDVSVVPFSRDYTLSFKDVACARGISITVNGSDRGAAFASTRGGYLTVCVEDVKPGDCVSVLLCDITPTANLDKKELLTELISKQQGSNNPKAAKYTRFVTGKGKKPSMPKPLADAVKEIESLWYEK